MYDKKFCQIIFIVGTPRSGTTLLQSKALQSLGCISCYESHFFSTYYFKNFTKRKYYSRYLESMKIVDELYESYIPNFEKINLLNNKVLALEAFEQFIFDYCRSKNANCFIEKTPKHLHYISKIKNIFPNNAIYLHVIRSRYKNVRSLYYASKDYPESWNGKKTIRQCIKRWEKDLLLHAKYIDEPKHYFVSYEKYLEQEDNFVFDKIKADCNMKINVSNTITLDEIIRKEEKWKRNNYKDKGVASNYVDFLTEQEFNNKYPKNEYIKKVYDQVLKKCL